MTLRTTAAIVTILLLVGAGGAAALTGAGPAPAVGVDGDDTTGETYSTLANAEASATLDNGTLTVAVTDESQPAENVSVFVDGERVGTTDANGTVAVDLATLKDDDEDREEIEIELTADGFEGELEYAVNDGSLSLLEEEYEYERPERDEDEEAEDDEESEDEEAEDDEESEDGE